METTRSFPLGLGVEGEAAPVREAVERADAAYDVSVIVPVRDEALNIGACLESLLAQDTPTFVLGRNWELIVVDDASTDATAVIAEGMLRARAGTELLTAPVLEMRGSARAFTGKTNACWCGAQRARGRWLLFTDADTVHEAASMVHALGEAQKHSVALLSYSPAQVVTGLAQRTLMPLVFSELASTYPPAEVNDPATRVAAANGQFLLVERETYFAVGGHRAVGRSVLEDVDLAWNVKRYAVRQTNAAVRNGVRLRYAPDALRTRMYRGFGDMAAGWTKNLALLFPQALGMAAWRVLDVLLWCLPLLLLLPHLVFWQQAAILLLWLRTMLRFYRRVARSNFGMMNVAISPLGLPLLVVLLVRSYLAHKVLHRVEWKGREYSSGR